jgi:hypothetical protein
VNHNQFEEVARMVGPRAGNATILVFNNVWDDLHRVAEPLPKEQVVWGFPGGGGGFRGQNRLEAGFMKSIFLESAASAASASRHQRIVDLFRNAGMAAAALKEGQLPQAVCVSQSGQASDPTHARDASFDSGEGRSVQARRCCFAFLPVCWAMSQPNRHFLIAP